LVAGNLAAEKKKFTVPPMAIVAGIVVVAGLVGFWFLDRSSKKGPPAMAPPTADAKAYAKNLKFVGADGVTPAEPAMESHESYLQQQIVEISGNLLNAGDKPINSVAIRWVFYEPGAVMPDGRLYQEIIWREQTYVITKKTGGLAPGQFKFFHVAFDDVPDSWNQAMPTPVIAAIEFK
jgi:hypothetical protein